MSVYDPIEYSRSAPIERTGQSDEKGTPIGTVHVTVDNAQSSTKGVLTYPVITNQPTSTKRLILAANLNRLSAEVINEGDLDVRLGDSNVTSALPYKLLQSGQSWFIKDSTSEIWGITAGGAASLQVTEVVKS